MIQNFLKKNHVPKSKSDEEQNEQNGWNQQKNIQQQQNKEDQIKQQQKQLENQSRSRKSYPVNNRQKTGVSGSRFEKKSDNSESARKSDNLFSQILDYNVYKQKNLNPEFLRIKNNILLIILMLSSFGIYYLFQDFLDVMLLAFIGGIGYQQMRQRFIRFWTGNEPFFQKQMTITVRILSIAFYLLAILLLPWLRTMFGHPDEFWQHLVLSDIVYSFSFKVNIVILSLQIIILLKVLHLILEPTVFPYLQLPFTKRNQEFYGVMFGIIFTLLCFVAIFFIPSIFVMEVSHGASRIQQKVQEYVGCQIINYSTHNNSKLPLCSEMFFNNNTFFEETFKQFQAQTSQIQDCTTYLSELQKKVIGYEFFHYQQFTCTWYLIVQKAATYFTPDTDVFTTSTTFFKTVFGNIAFVVMSFSNIIFSITTFLAIFYVTVKYFDSRSTMIQQIFFGERKQLFNQITNLIQATLYIVVEHFFLSIVLFELFNFSNFNLIISTLLSSMAFVPMFRPWFGAAFFCCIRSIFVGHHFINLIFAILYYYSSERIFSSRFKEMQFHEIITNLSILFGIYQFGIAGIFYGPIIMILFRSVHRQLLRNEVYAGQNESTNQGEK